ncbi:MAG TPA: sulfatase-like hydrolase/transferase [Longimicrobiaceae bacterium]|nr:sulfatase-like hydrolase/transferase [Longimicrobiaceae bacterium]
MKHLDRRTFLGRLAAAAGGALAAPASAAALDARAPAVSRRGGRGRPNVVFMMADDLGYGDLSGYGRADYGTPVLDRLAVEGMRFTHAYSAAPMCTPTRVGFMTGRYPARHPVGLREPLTGGDEDRGLGLEAAHPTVSSLLKGAGYTNALFGKWHLGLVPDCHPRRHGFDEFFGPLSGAVDHVSHTSWGELDLWENERPVRAEGYLQDLVIDRAVAFIRKRPEPFFLSIQGTAPHWPWQRRGDPPVGVELNTGPGDRFPDMVRILDEGVGRVLGALAEAGIAERTLVVFTSDNGGERYSSMGGLAGRKGSTWEGGIRVPAFARWPGVIPAGVTSAQAFTTLDLAATILSAAEAAPASTHPLDGIDLLPLLTGGEPPRDRTLFWRMAQRAQQGAVRRGTWKYHRDQEGERLFDLVLDPGERRDRKNEERERFAELRSAYDAWDAEMLPPLARGHGG